MNRSSFQFAAAALALLFLTCVSAQAKPKKPKKAYDLSANPLGKVQSQQPDKELYDKAMAALKKGRYDVARLDLQTLLNTYPESEYRMRAKLSVGDTWFKEGGTAALASFGLQVFQPLKPMLAASEPTLPGALSRIGGRAAIEWKLDGIRVQVHIAGGQVRLFTRTLDDITARLPEVVAAAAALPVESAVFDGELIALRPDGRPRPFQETAARAASEASPAAVPLSVFLFDILHSGGADLIDAPDEVRRQELERVVRNEMVMPRLVTDDPVQAAAFFADAVARGHEGVVVKSLAAPYAAGRRGAAWIKVKPRHTLDLVVLAAEWGHGRRRGWLSNLHLAARDPGTGGWVMLGKTFKGLTDELLTWQTQELLALEDHRDDWTVYVRPELVVEIAFDGVQRSPRYPGGVALRFARVLRYREDKPASEADTIAAVRALADS